MVCHLSPALRARALWLYPNFGVNRKLRSGFLHTQRPSCSLSLPAVCLAVIPTLLCPFLSLGGADLRISTGGRDVTALTAATRNHKWNLGPCTEVLLRLFHQLGLPRSSWEGQQQVSRALGAGLTPSLS